MDNNNDVTVKVTEHPHVRRTIIVAKLYGLFLLTVVVLGTIGYADYVNRAKLPIIADVAFWCVVVILVIYTIVAAIYPCVWLIRYIVKADFYDIGINGSYLRTLFGKNIALAPMALGNVKISQDKTSQKTVTRPIVPTVIEMLMNGDIAEGQIDMAMGYEAIGDSLKLVRDNYPGTALIAGKGRSGKTRRVIFMLFQVILARAIITICDPHATKADSLTSKLLPLAPWLHFAKTEDEIVEVARDYFEEMENRVSGISQEIFNETSFLPRLIVFDEWARLMTTDKISDDDKELLIKVAEECSKQYAGYNGFCWLISQVWTTDNCGSTTIRRSAQATFVHQISSEYAKFFFSNRKLQRRADELARRDCLYKNADSDVTEILTPTVQDNAMQFFSDYLLQIGSPTRSQLLPANRQKQIATSTHQDVTTTSIEPVDTSLEDATVSFQPDDSSQIERKNIDKNTFHETHETMKELHKPIETDETPMKFHQENTAFHETVTTKKLPNNEVVNPYSKEDEQSIITVAFSIMQQKGKVTREDIKVALEWNNAKYWIIRDVCDKHDIAMQNSRKAKVHQ